jgi:hypothetical protein
LSIERVRDRNGEYQDGDKKQGPEKHGGFLSDFNENDPAID